MANSRRPSRRSLIQGALATIGLAGAGMAAKLATGDDGGSGAAGAQAARPVEPALPARLYLDRYTLHSGGSGPERRKGDQSLLRGTLLTESGERAGEIFATAVTMPGPAEPDLPHTARMETQTLHLEGGTLTAVGTVFSEPGIPNLYTILGGTGIYAGARGTYRFDENPNVARPEGRAMLNFDLLT